jgi:hypothetical protein
MLTMESSAGPTEYGPLSWRAESAAALALVVVTAPA